MKASWGLIGLLGIVLVACGALATPTSTSTPVPTAAPTPTPVRYDDLAAAYLAGVYGPGGHPTTGTNVAFTLAKRFKQQQNLSDVEAYLKALEIVNTKFVLGVASAFGGDPPGLTAEQVRRASFLAFERQPEGMIETFRGWLRKQDPQYDVRPYAVRQSYDQRLPAAAATYRLLGGPFMLSNLGEPVRMSFREFLTEFNFFTPEQILQKLSDVSTLAESLQKKYGVWEFNLDTTIPAAEIFVVHTYTTRNLLNTPESRERERNNVGLDANELALADISGSMVLNLDPTLRESYRNGAIRHFTIRRAANPGVDFVDLLKKEGGFFR